VFTTIGSPSVKMTGLGCARRSSSIGPPHSGYVTVTLPDPLDRSDAQLVVSVARGDHDALAELYRRHGGATLSLATRLVRERSAAQDVVQDVFVGLWNDPSRFDPSRGALRSWLLMRTHTKAVDHIRSVASRSGREGRDANDRTKPAYDLELQVWDLAVADRVKDALGTLSDSERRAIDLAYFGGYSYREVADLLHQPEGTVKSRIRSGLKSMRKHLLDLGHDDHEDSPGSGEFGSRSDASSPRNVRPAPPNTLGTTTTRTSWGT
jgi:RNA polymerase sigma-70 factor, ECF subfamily